MKTRITALLLVLVMAVTLLCGCEYKYEKKNFGKYADPIDAQALKTALTNIRIEDEDFTTDEETREAKTIEALAETFAEYYADEAEAKEEGAIGDQDKVVVRYFLQMNKDSQSEELADAVYSLDTMKTDVSLSYATSASLAKAIYDALKAKGGELKYASVVSATDVTEIKADKTLSEDEITKQTTLKAGDYVFVSYVEKADGASAVQKTGWFTVSSDDTTFAGKLVGKEIGTTFAPETANAIEADGKQYYKITPVFVVTEGEGFVNECRITLTEEVKLTDAFGTTKTFGIPSAGNGTAGGVAYVFVSERYEIPDVSANENREVVLRTFLRSYDYTGTALSIFSSEDYAYKYTVIEGEEPTEKSITIKQIFDCLFSTFDEKNTGAVTNADIVTEALDADLLKDLKVTYEAAKAEYEEAKSKYDTENAKDEKDEALLTELKTDFDAKTKAKDDAEKAYNDADLWLDDTIKMILSADKVKEETEKDVKEALYNAFKQSKHDELEDNYEKAINTKVQTAVNTILTGAIKVNGAPKSAVRQAYNTNIDYYRYEYYEGSSAKTYQTNYKTVELYLQAVATSYLQSKDASAAAVTTKKARKAALKEQAEEQVKELMALYLTADALNEAFGTDLTPSKEAQLEYASQYLWYYQYLYSNIGYDTSAMTVQNVLNYMISDYGETNFKAMVLDDLIVSFLYETEENGGTLDFKNIHYTATAKAD